MFDVAPSEFFIVALVALIVIGPKDLPKAMRIVGYWVGRARGVTRQFRAGFDSMVREAELAEMEKKWAEENARILAEHPATAEAEALPPPPPDAAPGTLREEEVHHGGGEPVMVEKPVVVAAAVDTRPDAESKVGS